MVADFTTTFLNINFPCTKKKTIILFLTVAATYLVSSFLLSFSKSWPWLLVTDIMEMLRKHHFHAKRSQISLLGSQDHFYIISQVSGCETWPLTTAYQSPHAAHKLPTGWQRSQWRNITQSEPTGLCNTEMLSGFSDSSLHLKTCGLQNMSQKANVSKQRSWQ